MPNHSCNPLGISTNRTYGHMARSMILTEISQLISNCALETSLEDYQAAIIDENILAKPTFEAGGRGLITATAVSYIYITCPRKNVPLVLLMIS